MARWSLGSGDRPRGGTLTTTDIPHSQETGIQGFLVHQTHSLRIPDEALNSESLPKHSLRTCPARVEAWLQRWFEIEADSLQNAVRLLPLTSSPTESRGDFGLS